MKALMRLCVPAVLGVVTLFSVAPAAKAADAPATTPVSGTHLTGAILDGPYVFHSDAVDDADLRNLEGFDCVIYFDDGFYWVLCS